MVNTHKNNLSLLQFTNLGKFSEIVHFSTTRQGGCSEKNYQSLNLGFNSGDLPEKILTNRRILCETLDISTDHLIFPKQTHTATVKEITEDFFLLDAASKKQYLLDTDAVVTHLRGVFVAIKTADCVPVLLFDPNKKVVAAIHAGWRGTVQEIVSVTISHMAKAYETNPSDLWAGIGPSISPSLYEVGEEVWSQFDPAFCQPTQPINKEKRLLDLWGANQHQLRSSGVPEDQIEIAKICTLSNPHQFFSARRDGAKTGRMATGIMLKENG